MPGFFDLPRELRDLIYDAYLWREDGYVYNQDTGKLRAALQDDTIDLGLLSTCKQCAHEMKGRAFELNNITFTTILSPKDDLNHRVRQFSGAFQTIYRAKTHIIYSCRQYISSEVAHEVTEQFPTSKALIHHLTTTPFDDAAVSIYKRTIHNVQQGQSLSVKHDNIAHLLQAIPRTDAFIQSLRQVPYLNDNQRSEAYVSARTDMVAVAELSPVPWAIPSSNEIARLSEINLPNFPYATFDRPHDRMHFCFSAAALAIDFLKRLHSPVRLQIRGITLVDKHTSVAEPQCHAMGLIPFAIENPSLRIARRVDVWSNIFANCQLLFWVAFADFGLSHFHITYALTAIKEWIMEVSALRPAGMPSDAFQLIFYSDIAPIQSFFDGLVKNAAWQVAFEQNLPDLTNGATQPDLSGVDGYVFFDGFPQAMRDIVAGTSSIRFDACVGDVGAIEREASELLNFTSVEDVKNGWMSLMGRQGPVVPPAPLTWDDVFRVYLRADRGSSE